MAKRVQVGVPGVRLNETSYAVLCAIARYSEAQHVVRCAPVEMSYKLIAAHAGVSSQAALRSCAALRDNGLLLVEHTAAASGGQGANIYQITALGLEVLRLAQPPREFESRV